MSKELVISAASHERRVAILEEGQLVEIYIEREKEFALVGSIYKGRVTRVLPGMQSAFVDIGLDGDAFLYVSDVFENLEDYDHDHDHGHAPQASALPPAAAALVEAVPGESLAHAHSSDEAAPVSADDAAQQAILHEEPLHADFTHEHEHDAPAEQALGEAELDGNREPHAEAEERQPDSNASAPQNFGQFNPTQKYSRPDRGNDRGGQNFRGDRGGDRGSGGRWGRRGGRRRSGGRPPQGGRNLPPSKYASPQGDQRPRDSRGGYDSRSPQPRAFEPRDNRRPEGSRFSPPSAPASSGEDDIVLPGESLAKYRNKPAAAAAAPAPALIEPEIHEPQPDLGDSISSRGNVQQAGTPSGANVPRRSSGGLPRWLLAETGNEAETSSTGTEGLAPSADDTATTAPQLPSAAPDVVEQERTRTDASLSDEDVAVISSSLIEAKHEETQAHAAADTLVGGAVFEEEEEEQEEDEEESEEENEETETEDGAEEHEEIRASETESESQDVGAEEIHAIETRALDSHALREAEADAAHESALHAAAIGDHEIHEETRHEPVEATGTESAPEPVVAEDDSILLPGETRAPRSGAPEPRQDFPRDSVRIGGNPRARFQRPYRSGGRDRDNRGRDNRGGGRPDRRGGRPGGGPRFERRPGGPHRHHDGHSGPSRRPQLISEMLKAGQDIVIQIAKEPLGKKGARITSHVALPGRFLVYMPTIDHIGVSRKIAAAEN